MPKTDRARDGNVPAPKSDKAWSETMQKSFGSVTICFVCCPTKPGSISFGMLRAALGSLLDWGKYEGEDDDDDVWGSRFHCRQRLQDFKNSCVYRTVYRTTALIMSKQIELAMYGNVDERNMGVTRWVEDVLGMKITPSVSAVECMKLLRHSEHRSILSEILKFGVEDRFKVLETKSVRSNKARVVRGERKEIRSLQLDWESYILDQKVQQLSRAAEEHQSDESEEVCQLSQTEVGFRSSHLSESPLTTVLEEEGSHLGRKRGRDFSYEWSSVPAAPGFAS